MPDRGLAIAFGFSVTAHLLLILIQDIPWNPAKAARPIRPMEVVYEQQEAARLKLMELKERLRTSKSLGPGNATGNSEGAHIRIPDQPALASAQPLSTWASTNPSSVVDLTNLVEASRGDPVLLSYFGAIREQIQRTANERAWLSGVSAEGLIYISFLLNANGTVRHTTVVAERSVSSQPLWAVATRIVEAAAPFPPFPPSMSDQGKTIVVPLEFLLR
ncbi:MAG: hypothetical protein HYY57_07340 [Candidatus Omnitrophica bacterium]|nr:hypothetical protein [Candidatus Omnitrophota bacterium]